MDNEGRRVVDWSGGVCAREFWVELYCMTHGIYFTGVGPSLEESVAMAVLCLCMLMYICVCVKVCVCKKKTKR